jgi:RNA polymerase sigma-70 factor (ECF subfamily)
MGSITIGTASISSMTRFQTTQWHVIVAARDDGDGSRLALEALCCAYREPVLAYMRALARRDEDPEELTQSFFLQFLQHRFDRQADRQRGRFRLFIKAAVRHFLSNSRNHAAAAKRSAGSTVRIDEEGDIVDRRGETPDRAFEREWALAVLRRAFAKLRSDAVRAGKSNLFDRLSEFIVDQPDAADYDRAAAELGMARGTIAVTVHRLRERLRNQVRTELAQTVAGEHMLDAELESLRRALADRPVPF